MVDACKVTMCHAWCFFGCSKGQEMGVCYVLVDFIGFHVDSLV